MRGPDFNSFLKKGDERLKLLEQVDRLPDLQSDFRSQYKVVYRRAKELRGGLSPDISPQKLKELLGGDGAARPQGRQQLEPRRLRWPGGHRGRADRPRHAGHGEGPEQDARHGGAGAIRQGVAGRPRVRSSGKGRERGRAARAADPTSRISEKVRDCLPGRARAARPRARRPSASGPTRSTSGSRAGPRRGKKDGYDTKWWAGRADAVAPAVHGGHRSVPQDDGGRDHAGGRFRATTTPRSRTTSGPGRAIGVATSPRQQVFSSDFLAQLERRRSPPAASFRGHVKGERRSPRKGQSVEFSDYRAYGVGDDLPLRRLEHLRPHRSPARQALRRRGGSVFAPPGRRLLVHGLWTSVQARLRGAPGRGAGLRRAREPGARRSRHPARAGGRGVGARRAAATSSWRWPGSWRVCTRAAGPDSTAGWRTTRPAGGSPGSRSSSPTSSIPGGYEAGLRALLERRFDVHVVHLLDPGGDESRNRRRSTAHR